MQSVKKENLEIWFNNCPAYLEYFNLIATELGQINLCLTDKWKKLIVLNKTLHLDLE